MSRKYRIIFGKGRYYPQKRFFFMWFSITVELGGYNIVKNFPTYREAMGFITLYDKKTHGNENYRIVR